MPQQQRTLRESTAHVDDAGIALMHIDCTYQGVALVNVTAPTHDELPDTGGLNLTDADTALTAHGWTRTGGWTPCAAPGAHDADITRA